RTRHRYREPNETGPPRAPPARHSVVEAGDAAVTVDVIGHARTCRTGRLRRPRTPGDRCQSLRMVTGCSERGGSLMRGARLPRIAGMALVLVFAGGCDFVVRARVDTTGGGLHSASPASP